MHENQIKRLSLVQIRQVLFDGSDRDRPLTGQATAQFKRRGADVEDRDIHVEIVCCAENEIVCCAENKRKKTRISCSGDENFSQASGDKCS